MNNCFCIIQGPIITYGQGPNDSIEGFNASECILANIKKLEALGIKYVLCLWEMDKELAAQTFGDKLVFKLLHNPFEEDIDHRFKHHYSILKGIEFLESEYNSALSDLVFKIRTDMEMPDSFWNLLSTEKDITDKLLVSHLFDTFYIGDFLYYGKVSTLKKYTTSITSTYPKVYHPSISHDLGIKYFSSFNRFNPLANYFTSAFCFSFFSFLLAKIWDKFVKDYLITLPEETWKGIKWRNKPMMSVVNAADFYFTGSGYALKKELWGLKTYRYFRGLYIIKKYATKNAGNKS